MSVKHIFTIQNPPLFKKKKQRNQFLLFIFYLFQEKTTTNENIKYKLFVLTKTYQTEQIFQYFGGRRQQKKKIQYPIKKKTKKNFSI